MATNQLPQRPARTTASSAACSITRRTPYVCSTSRVITYTNETTSRQLGFSAEDFLQRTTLDFVHPDDLVRARRLFEQPLTHWERPITAQVRCRAPRLGRTSSGTKRVTWPRPPPAQASISGGAGTPRDRRYFSARAGRRAVEAPLVSDHG